MTTGLVFPCAHCREWLEAPPEMAELMVECPRCGTVFRVPAESVPRPAAPVPPPVTPAPGDNQADARSTTLRIDLPPGLGLPPPPPRRRLILRRR